MWYSATNILLGPVTICEVKKKGHSLQTSSGVDIRCAGPISTPLPRALLLMCTGAVAEMVADSDRWLSGHWKVESGKWKVEPPAFHWQK